MRTRWRICARVALAFTAIADDAGLRVRFQFGEPRWWTMPDGRPCLYDDAARDALDDPVEIPTLYTPLDAALIAVLDAQAPETKRANLPLGWASPAFDTLQLEDYDWAVAGNVGASARASRRRRIGSVIRWSSSIIFGLRSGRGGPRPAGAGQRRGAGRERAPGRARAWRMLDRRGCADRPVVGTGGRDRRLVHGGVALRRAARGNVVAPREGMAFWNGVEGGVARRIDGEWVVAPPPTAIAEPSGGSVVDIEARAAIGAVLAALSQHHIVVAP